MGAEGAGERPRWRGRQDPAPRQAQVLMRERWTGPPQRSQRAPFYSQPQSPALPEATRPRRPPLSSWGPSRSDHLTREAPTQSGGTAPSAPGTNSHMCLGNPEWKWRSQGGQLARESPSRSKLWTAHPEAGGAAHPTVPPSGNLVSDWGLPAGGWGRPDASPEGRVREGVRGQVAGVIVGCGGGRVQAEWRQGGHAEVLGRVVGPEAPQVVLSHRAGGYHVVHRPLQAAGGRGRRK